MLYNLDWLREGEVFPPASEIERLVSYRDNRALFYGDNASVLEPYRQRIQTVLDKFAEFGVIIGSGAGVLDTFITELNYFQLMTLKTGDLVAGEPPTITKKSGEDVGETLSDDIDFETKLLDIVYDLSRFGDSIARVYLNEDTKQRDFIVSQPDMWFPVVDYENNKNIKQHVLAWIECLNPQESRRDKRKYILKAQVHHKGKYDRYEFAAVDMAADNIRGTDGRNLKYPQYRIEKQMTPPVGVSTGLADFAIVPFFNVRTSDSCFGISDYDRICGIIAELEVRYSIENAILDKHSCPTPYVPKQAVRQNMRNEWTFTPGGVIPIGKDDATPGYMTFDASLQANHEMIVKLEAHLHSLSEMGAVIDDDAFGASQGFEALETRMSNARLKARRMSSRMTRPVKKLISLLTEKSGNRVSADEISVYWNDGLPNNEYREVDIATKKLALFDLATILMEHFGKTQEEAEAIAERVTSARANMFADYSDDPDDDGEDNSDAGDQNQQTQAKRPHKKE